MAKGLVIADAGPIISLAIIDQWYLFESLFTKVRIPSAVWEEITRDDSKPCVNEIKQYFYDKVEIIESSNELFFVMDFGESEAILLYKELSADYLLIDDKKARSIAETLGVICIGTIGILAVAKERGIIKELKPLFEKLLENKRYYSVTLLNSLLSKFGEEPIYTRR